MTRVSLSCAAWLFFCGHFLLFELGGCHGGETPRDLSKQTTSKQRASRNVEPVVQIGHSGSLRDIVFSPNKKYFLTTRWHGNRSAGNVILWDTNSGDKLRAFPVNTHTLKPSFCLDGQAVVLGGNVWDINTGKQRYAILKDDEVPAAARLSADRRCLIVGTKAGRVRVIDLETGKTIASFTKPRRDTQVEKNRKNKRIKKRYITDVGFTADNTPLVLMIDKNGTGVYVWNVATKEKLAEFHTSDTIVGSAIFSPHARHVATRYWGDTGEPFETTRVYDASTGKEIVVSDEWIYDGKSVKFTSDGRFYASGTGHKKATLWDLQTGQAVHHFGDHARPIYMMRLLDDGKVLETQSYDVAQRWDLKSGKLLKAFRDPDFSDSPKTNWPPVQPLLVPSPDGKTFICRGRVFNAETGNPHCKLEKPITDYEWRHHRRLRAGEAVYKPDSDKVIVSYSGRKDSLSVLFDVASGKAVKQLARSPVSRNRLQWNRNASRALTLPEGLHRLWDVEKGRSLQTIGTVEMNADGTVNKNVRYAIPNISFSDNGKFVYMYGQSWGAFFWDAETGKALHHGPPSQGTTGKDGLVDFPLPIGGWEDEQGQGPLNKRGLVDSRKYHLYYKGCSVLSSDRHLLASSYSCWHFRPGDRSYKILIWDVEKGSVLQILDHSDMRPPLIPFFSPDGQHFPDR